MPDITMCPSVTCPYRTKCYRSPDSGTQPNEWRQSWFAEDPSKFDGGCEYFWEREDTK